MLPLLPDVVALAIQALAAQPAIAALIEDRLYDRVPAAPAWPLLVVGTVDDGVETEPGLSLALLQVDCWGRSGSPTHTAEARLLARTVRAAAPDLRGTWPAGRIASAHVPLLLPQPDTTTGRARFLVQLEMRSVPSE